MALNTAAVNPRTLDAGERSRRVEALRAELEQRKLAAYIVPRSDEYMLEYVPASGERLAWLTGFTGSAGMAVVGRSRAALFVDGRYTEQAREQSPEPLWEHHHLIDAPPASWIEQALKSGERVGYDPRVHTPSALESLKAAAQRAGASLAAVQLQLEAQHAQLEQQRVQLEEQVAQHEAMIVATAADLAEVRAESEARAAELASLRERLAETERLAGRSVTRHVLDKWTHRRPRT